MTYTLGHCKKVLADIGEWEIHPSAQSYTPERKVLFGLMACELVEISGDNKKVVVTQLGRMALTYAEEATMHLWLNVLRFANMEGYDD
jgi:hypothetical protein